MFASLLEDWIIIRKEAERNLLVPSRWFDKCKDENPEHETKKNTQVARLVWLPNTTLQHIIKIRNASILYFYNENFISSWFNLKYMICCLEGRTLTVMTPKIRLRHAGGILMKKEKKSKRKNIDFGKKDFSIFSPFFWFFSKEKVAHSN